MIAPNLINKLDWKKMGGLVPVIVQDAKTKEVLMLAYANKEALENTLKTGKGTYWSRSRNELWVKGETSGHTQKVTRVVADCDYDAVLYIVEQTGSACHTGDYSCFHNSLQCQPE
jgi:phosphoribosyl-AMP cyclohydrolase